MKLSADTPFHRQLFLFNGLLPALLMLIDAGALVAQLAVLHGDVIHCLVIGAVLAALIHLQRDSLAGRLVGRIDVP